MAEMLVLLQGPVRCLRSDGVLGLTLAGAAAGEPPGPCVVAFSGAAPAGLPDTLSDVRIERLAPAHYRIASGGRDWLLEAKAVHVQRDVRAAFYSAIPPQRAPWRRRVFFRIVLFLAASRRGLMLLQRLRR